MKLPKCLIYIQIHSFFNQNYCLADRISITKHKSKSLQTININSLLNLIVGND